MDRSKKTETLQECSERKRGQSPFAGTARRVLRQKGAVPFSFPCVTSIVLQFFWNEPYFEFVATAPNLRLHSGAFLP